MNLYAPLVRLRQRLGQALFSLHRRRAPPTERKWELTAAELAACHRVWTRECSAADVLDEQTWSDLEMERVRARLDRSVTPLGAQYTYALLRLWQCGAKSLAENVSACPLLLT
jgi:hypothetical protein